MVLGPHGLTMVPTDTLPYRTHTETLSLQCIAHYVYNRLSLRGAASSGPGASARIAWMYSSVTSRVLCGFSCVFGCGV